jgi:DNA-directed RNA polymerase subunit RPC12/RpoP
MKMKQFTKRDEEFICDNCGKKVEKLGYTSRDHCPHCLCSKHVDITPGDRANECKGLLKPVQVEMNNKKGFIINYKCEKCGKTHRNKAADDDNKELLIQLTVCN